MKKLRTFKEIHDDINSRGSNLPDHSDFINLGRQNACNDFWNELRPEAIKYINECDTIFIRTGDEQEYGCVKGHRCDACNRFMKVFNIIEVDLE